MTNGAKRKTWDLPHKKTVTREGLEPSTYRLRVCCSMQTSPHVTVVPQNRLTYAETMVLGLKGKQIVSREKMARPARFELATF